MGNDKPRVFISYAWTNEEYVSKVVDLARRLMSDGVDVLLDKFEMNPGKALISFMERCVNDSSISKVVILLNPAYARKANEKDGGVGTESQIISQEVYGNVEQTKFIPVIFVKNGDDFDESTPTFLRGRIRLNLSDEDTFEAEYVNLVKTIYGKSMFKKPALGVKPAWVDDDFEVSAIAHKIRLSTRKSDNKNRSNEIVDELLLSLESEILNDEIFVSDSSWEDGNFFSTYCHLLKYRNDFLEILLNTYNQKNITQKYIKFFERINLHQIGFMNNNSGKKADFFRTLNHELFIYTIATFLKKDMFSEIGNLTSRPYICLEPGRGDKNLVSFSDFFYSYRIIARLLKSHFDARDSKDYYSGLAMAWMENIYSPNYTKSDFINADILLTNLSMCKTNFKLWFACTYVYESDRTKSIVRKISIALKSKILAEEYFALFNCNNIQQLNKAINNLCEFAFNYNGRIGYSVFVDTIPIISDYIKPDEVGIED